MDPHRKHELETQRILDEKFKRGAVKHLTVPEKLEGISEIKSFDERVKALRANSERSFNTILHYTYGDFKWVFTKEEILGLQYKETPVDEDVSIQGTNLIQEARRLYVFLDGTKANKDRLQSILIQILENIHPDEAEILKGMFLGDIPYKNITKKLVSTAFPDLFPEDQKEEVKKPQGKRGRPPKKSSPGSTTESVKAGENKSD